MITFDDVNNAYSILKNVVHKTPLLNSRSFNNITGLDVYFKAENFQRIGAFKIRGAYNKIVSLSQKLERLAEKIKRK